MLKAVLIDIDNTMVLFDEPRFYRRYFKVIAPYFGDFYPPKEFLERLFKATQSLRNNNGQRPNVDHFMRVLTEGDAENRTERIWQRFMEFYTEEYGRIQRQVKAPEGLRETLGFLTERNLKLVAASNPIFPKRIHLERMAWVGIEPHFPWDLITHVENMSYVKPRTGYFHEISSMIGIPPEQCLMVGNDTLNDMAAGHAGMKTYLTTDGNGVDYASLQMTVTRDDPAGPIRPDFTGPFNEILQVVTRLTEEQKTD